MRTNLIGGRFLMKKSGFVRCLVSLVLVFMLLVPAAIADNVDLSSMTDDEITELLTRVNAEVVNRGISKTAKLPQGSYIGGKELPAGKYIFTCLATGNDWGNVTVHTDGGKGDLVTWEVVTAPQNGEEPDTIFITLNEGDELKSGVPFSLTIMSGVLFQ